MVLKKFGFINPHKSLYKDKEDMKLRLTKTNHAKVVSYLLLGIMLWLPLVSEAGGGERSGILQEQQQRDNYERAMRQDEYKNSSNSSNAKLNNNDNNSASDNVTTSVSSSSSSVSIASVPKIQSNQNQKREVKFPTDNNYQSTSTTPKSSKKGGFESLRIPSEEEKQQEKLKSALLNHSLHSHDDDKDLDRLVFSQLPEGSKLILRTVKIVRTDDDGNEEDVGDEVTSWDVVVANGTTNEDEDDFEEEEETNSKHDLISAASHPTSRYNSHSHGSNQQNKDKETKYYDEKDHGKHRAQTFTDTDGTKLTNYKGTEKGLTDFANSHGNSQSNEGGRFKDSKKKNKGRKVTGFKRVYHKEEFQRTEHFYDDEDLKRIAEQFGTNDQKEKSSHGLKDDERKYHGVRKDITDGQKVKNEKGTTDSFNKGHHQSLKNSEHHNHGQNYAHHQQQHQGPVYGRTRHSHSPTSNHANHNYDGAYSTNNKVTSSVGNSDSVIESNSNTDSSNRSPRTENPKTQLIVTPMSPQINNAHKAHVQSSRLNDHSNAQRLRPVKSVVSSSSSSTSTGSVSGIKGPSMAMMAPATQLLLAKPSEMKVFVSPRERYYPYSDNDASMAYAPNFGPSQKPNNGRGSSVKIGNFKFTTLHPQPSKPLYGPKINFNNNNPRYAGNYPTINKDSIPPLYSTIIKTVPKGNLISIEKSKEHPVPILMSNLPGLETSSSTTENGKNILNGKYRVRPQIGWIPIGHSKTTIPIVSSIKDPLQPLKEVGTRNRPEGISFTKLPFNPLRLGQTVLPIKFFRKPTTPLPLNTNTRAHSHTNQHVVVRPIATSGIIYTPTGQPSTISYNVKKNPQFSNFMNGLMDSVAGFFGRIG